MERSLNIGEWCQLCGSIDDVQPHEGQGEYCTKCRSVFDNGPQMCEDRWDTPCSGKLLPVTRYAFRVCERHADHRAKLGRPIDVTAPAKPADAPIREPAEDVGELRRELELARLEAAALGSQLLDVQQDCICARVDALRQVRSRYREFRSARWTTEMAALHTMREVLAELDRAPVPAAAPPEERAPLVRSISPELRATARRAIVSLAARVNEDIDAWAERLARSACGLDPVVCGNCGNDDAGRLAPAEFGGYHCIDRTACIEGRSGPQRAPVDPTARAPVGEPACPSHGVGFCALDCAARDYAPAPQVATPAEPERPVPTLLERINRFKQTTGALSGGNTHPDRCVCQGDDPTPHTHYVEPPHSCARCGHLRCKAYEPAEPSTGAPAEPAPVGRPELCWSCTHGQECEQRCITRRKQYEADSRQQEVDELKRWNGQLFERVAKGNELHYEAEVKLQDEVDRLTRERNSMQGLYEREKQQHSDTAGELEGMRDERNAERDAREAESAAAAALVSSVKRVLPWVDVAQRSILEAAMPAIHEGDAPGERKL